MHIKSVPTQKYLHYAIKTKVWKPVVRDGWIIKFSQFRDSFLLLTIVSQYTGQTIIRYFNNEDEACTLINLIVCLDPSQTHEFL